MKILVIGSCTGRKDTRNCPDPLTEADFADPSLFQRRQAELSAWALPATELYTGFQHRYMMHGVKALRDRFGSSACAVKIVSAGYGLVHEDQRLVPYEATFQGTGPRWILEQSNRLGVPKAIRQAVIGYDVVLFLLGKEYLISTRPPLVPELSHRFLFFTSDRKLAFHPNSIRVPAGPKETRFGAGITALKGKMFEGFALGLRRAPEMWVVGYFDTW
jgi:hypothetical protein